MFDKRIDFVRFLAVVDTGAIAQAANRLGMSQPALTRFISRLERRFGDVLFERLPKGVRLTPLGETVAELARPLLRDIDAAADRLRAVRAGLIGSFRLTAGPLWTRTVLPEAAARFHEAFPRIELHIETTTRAEGLRRLEDGQSDLHCGGIDTGDPLPQFLRRKQFLNLTAGIVAHRDHPLLNRSIDFSDLASYPWIDYDACAVSTQASPAPGFTELLAALYARTRARAETVIRTGTASMMLMARGPYLAWLSLEFIERLPDKVLRPLPVAFGRFPYRSGFVARRTAEDLAPFRVLQDVLRETALGRRG